MSGMGDELGCVNVASRNMLSFTGSDGEAVGNESDVAVEVGTQSSDFGQEAGEAKEPSVPDVLDFQYYKTESRDKDPCRRTSPVEILRRNFGISRTSVSGGDSIVESPRELEKIDSMLENLEHRRLSGTSRTQCSSSLNDAEERNSGSLTSLESEDADIPLSLDKRHSRRAEDPHQAKEHVYCTVYCIANDNYRKRSETTLSSEHGSPSASDLSVLPPTDSSNSDPDGEFDHYPEPYKLSDLADPPVLSNVLYVNNIILQCRVCLFIRSIRSLHCCKKPVCEECMKTYISSQVYTTLALMPSLYFKPPFKWEVRVFFLVLTARVYFSIDLHSVSGIADAGLKIDHRRLIRFLKIILTLPFQKNVHTNSTIYINNFKKNKYIFKKV